MTFYHRDGARPLGDGFLAPAGSITDSDLAARASGYKRNVAGRYRAISPEEIGRLPNAPMLVSPKIDGQLWYLAIDASSKEDPVLIAPNGKVLGGELPLMKEIQQRVVPRVHGGESGWLLVPGELFALRKGGRPRVGDLGAALGGGRDADVARLGFFAFDLVAGGDAETPDPPAEYRERLSVLQRLFDGGQRAQAIRTDLVHTYEEVQQRFSDWVEGGKGEGLVVRQDDGRIYKLKPVFHLDAAIIGFTEQTDAADHVRSILLALLREDGQFQVLGSCGNLGTDAFRAELFQALRPDVAESKYRFASSTGALYRFVEPKVVVEVKVTDLQVDDGQGRPIRRMVLDFEAQTGWTPIQLKNGASMIHPIFVRRRDDKEVNVTDVRARQILERVQLEELDEKVARIERPESEVQRREVYVKETKGRKAVRKLLVWKTNKEDVDPEFPAWVVHWTDYSPGRKEPLQREVRLAPDGETAARLAEQMIEKGVKRGWQRVD
ncbi:MAG: hypothetical protein MPN21_03520 [Thermoanaerobaculia bacterium]|nr:hypothetical protein [Thermoanaerobaculia bacterium]